MSDLALFAVYEHPLDFPDAFVVRRFMVGTRGVVPDPQPHAVAVTLEAARAALPDGLYRFDRLDDDEPQIVETWL